MICQFVKLPKTSINFARIPPLSEFSHCFCPNFSHCFFPNFQLLLPEFWGKTMGNLGKNNGKFGQKEWKNLCKSNEKTRKAAAYISGIAFSPNFPLLCPKFLLHFPEFPICFCPNFPLLLPEIFRFQFFWGHSAPLPPPPPPTPMSIWVCAVYDVSQLLPPPHPTAPHPTCTVTSPRTPSNTAKLPKPHQIMLTTLIPVFHNHNCD